MIQYEKNWIFVEEDEEKGIQIHFGDDTYEAFFFNGKCVYYILSNADKETLKRVVDGMVR